MAKSGTPGGGHSSGGCAVYGGSMAMEDIVKSVIAVPYSSLINAKIIVPVSNEHIEIDIHFLKFCMQLILEKIQLDERWYLSTYPDIQVAIQNGEVSSAAVHYVRHGYFENRLPYLIEVDPEWYMEQYPDISLAVSRREFLTPQDHFQRAGFGEGRLPYPGFSLKTISGNDDQIAEPLLPRQAIRRI
jgi:hypothetical protein